MRQDRLYSGVLSRRSGTPADEPILRSAIDHPHHRSCNCRYAYNGILALYERWKLPFSRRLTPRLDKYNTFFTQIEVEVKLNVCRRSNLLK